MANEAQLKITLRMAQPPNTDWMYYFIDCGQVLSRVNRRLYRQGYTYVLDNIAVYNQTSDSTFTEYQVGAMPTTWPVYNSWKKAYAAWKYQIREATKFVDIQKPKWQDFKIFMNQKHYDIAPVVQDGAGNSDAAYTYLSDPIDMFGNGLDIVGTEWRHSEIFVPIPGETSPNDSQKAALWMLGDTKKTGADQALPTKLEPIEGYGLIYEYNRSRTEITKTDSTEPMHAETGMYSLLNYQPVADNVIDEVEEDNDTPPYDKDSHDMSALAQPWLQSQVMTMPAQAVSVAHSGPVVAPCGLILLGIRNGTVADPPAVDDINIRLEFAPGPYRGVLAKSMHTGGF